MKWHKTIFFLLSFACIPAWASVDDDPVTITIYSNEANTIKLSHETYFIDEGGTKSFRELDPKIDGATLKDFTNTLSKLNRS